MQASNFRSWFVMLTMDRDVANECPTPAGEHHLMDISKRKGLVTMDDRKIKQRVKERYAAVAIQSTSCCGPGCCSGDGTGDGLLVDYGLIDAELPVGANLGLGCGMPTLSVEILPGDTVLDLGSGAGVDAFLAARQVGPDGRVIGVDMTPEMIARAQENALKGGYLNVEFRLGEIEQLPVENGSVDVVLSNCVINLVPDKRIAFAEIFRVLKKGGRFSISDIVTFGEIPQSVRDDMDLWTGCIGGALDREIFLQIVSEAGFKNVEIKKSVTYDMLKGDSYGVGSITVEAHKL
jgi:SAM-dependent methyltransferase